MQMRKLFVVVCFLGLLMFLNACGVKRDTDLPEKNLNSQSSEAVTTSTQQEKELVDEPTWNVKDTNIETNGNVNIAIRLLKNISGDELKEKSEYVNAANVMKAPWKYYGKIVKLTGVVGIAQEYPPGGDVSKAFGGGEIGELVLTDENFTFIDYIQLGNTGDINVGDEVNVYGYPVGLVDVQNKLGGTTTQLVIIGKVAEKIESE